MPDQPEPTTPTDLPRWLEYIDVEELVPDPRNPKGHADRDIDASMERFAYTEPVLLDERTGMLVAGHGRRERVLAKKAAGADPPEGIVVTDDGRWMVPVNRGWASADDDEAEAYLVASNHLTEKGGWVEQALADILSKHMTADSLDGLGYTTDEITDMLASLEGPSSLDDLGDKYGEPDPQDLWPVLRFKVAPALKERFLKLAAVVSNDDATQLEYVVGLAEQAVVAAAEQDQPVDAPA